MIEQQKRDTVDKILNENSNRKRNNQNNNGVIDSCDQNGNGNDSSRLRRRKRLEGEVWKYRNDRSGITIQIPKESQGIVFHQVQVMKQVSQKCKLCS